MRTKSLLLALLGTFGVGACSPSREIPYQELYESSTSFDNENVRPFLIRLSGMVDSGFGGTEVDQVMEVIGSLALDQEQELSFPIIYSGSPTQVRITVFADDVDVIDVTIFSPKTLADAIDSEMEVFFDELGM